MSWLHSRWCASSTTEKIPLAFKCLLVAAGGSYVGNLTNKERIAAYQNGLSDFLQRLHYNAFIKDRKMKIETAYHLY
ncbi:hypothetical protein OH492_22555 [Vibrio chagasii]|nr:hypothetical protein [Vibrio chagasii]